MRLPLVIVLLAVAATPAAGQERLTLTEAVRAALRTHPSMMAADAALDRAVAIEREAGASMLPLISLDAAATRHQKPMLVAPLHGFDPANLPQFEPTLLQGTVTLAWTAFDGGARAARAARAGSMREEADASVASTRGAVIQEASHRYLRVMTLREQLVALDARVSALERERQRAAQLLSQGRAARVVLLRAEAAASAARAEHATLAAALAAAERELARVMGTPSDEITNAQLSPATTLQPAPSRADLLARARAASPELRRLEALVSAAEAGAEEAASQYWPRVHAGGRYVRFGSNAGDAGGEWQAGVQLSYTLFSAGARPAARERARADVRQARAQLALAELRLASQVEAALAQLESAGARVDAWQSAVAQSEEVARIERLALDTGAGVQADYLTAEAELLRARASLAEARAAELHALIELARASGELTPEWLEQNLESGS